MDFGRNDVLAARDRVYRMAYRTPLVEEPPLSERFGGKVFSKLENLQNTGSFKIRGAANKVLSLDRSATPGVIAASAGNHARGVARASRVAGIPATLVMPVWAPVSKSSAAQREGGEGTRIFLRGDSFDDAYAHAKTIAVLPRPGALHLDHGPPRPAGAAVTRGWRTRPAPAAYPEAEELTMKRLRPLCVLAASCIVVAGCAVSSPITIADGAVVEGGRTTVNGGISIGSGCEVRGNCRTVNGRITVGSSTEVGSLHTVNGSVEIARDVVVAGSVGTVNGSLSLAENDTGEGDLETVNGALSSAGGTATGEASTVNGTILARRHGSRTARRPPPPGQRRPTSPASGLGIGLRYGVVCRPSTGCTTTGREATAADTRLPASFSSHSLSQAAARRCPSGISPTDRTRTIPTRITPTSASTEHQSGR